MGILNSDRGLFLRHYGIVEPIVRQPLMALDARVAQRGVLVAAEGKHRGVHVLGVEYAQADQQVEVLDGEASHRSEEIRLELGDDVLECILAEIGEVHEGRDARGELDELDGSKNLASIGVS